MFLIRFVLLAHLNLFGLAAAEAETLETSAPPLAKGEYVIPASFGRHPCRINGGEIETCGFTGWLAHELRPDSVLMADLTVAAWHREDIRFDGQPMNIELMRTDVSLTPPSIPEGTRKQYCPSGASMKWFAVACSIRGKVAMCEFQRPACGPFYYSP